MRLLRTADRVAAPWKNGGGVTFEVAAEPPGAGLEDFGWRISTAVVEAAGPFSRFDGVDRVLLVIAGAAMDLSLAGAPLIRLDRATAPFVFGGDVPVMATLPAGAIVDLNVMTRRGRWEADVQRRRMERPVLVEAAEPRLLMALDALRLEAPPEGQLGPRDAVWLEAGERLALAPVEAGAELVEVVLRPIH